MSKEYFKKVEEEALGIVADWLDGKTCDLCWLHDDVLKAVEQMARDEGYKGRDLLSEAEYAWHIKYGRSGGYSGDEEGGW